MQMLKAMREQKNLSQVRLAARADMNPATVWRIETGQRSPTVEQLERLAAAMDLEVADFFPKVQVPLQLEEKERTAGEVVAEAIAVTAGEWLEHIGGWEKLDQDERDRLIGRCYAAIELRDALIPHLASESLPNAGQRDELFAVTGVLNRVVEELVDTLEADSEHLGKKLETAEQELGEKGREALEASPGDG